VNLGKWGSRMSQSIFAAIKKYLRLGKNEWKFFSHSFGGWQVQKPGSGRFCVCRGPFPAPQTLLHSCALMGQEVARWAMRTLYEVSVTTILILLTGESPHSPVTIKTPPLNIVTTISTPEFWRAHLQTIAEKDVTCLIQARGSLSASLLQTLRNTS
jgi:hypothetical protein